MVKIAIGFMFDLGAGVDMTLIHTLFTKKLRHFIFLRHNIDEKFIEKINNLSLSIQLQRIKYLEMYQFKLDLLINIMNCLPLNFAMYFTFI